jgi:hypothetical protein
MEDKFGDTWWQTSQGFPLSQAANLLHGSVDWLRELVEHPLAEAASRAGAASPIVPIEAGIAANFVTARLTEPLEAAARACEIAGIVIGLGAGVPPLVIACAKLYARDQLGQVLSREFEEIINSIGVERGAPQDRDTGSRREVREKGDHPRDPARSQDRDTRTQSDAYREPGAYPEF